MRVSLSFFRIVFLMLFLSSCYVVKNAYHMGRHLSSRRSISEILEDPSTSLELKNKLLILQEILDFAKEEGLNTRATYEYYLDIGNSPVSFLVFAAQKDRLISKTWWFPFVGKVPYLGFFDKKSRDEEAAVLTAEGLDVYLGEASAFSGLGWFSDPVFSSFLNRSLSSLANLIFHELVHRTIWIKGEVKFNEQLAEFVAASITRKFLEKKLKYGELKSFEEYLMDRKLFANWVNELKIELKSLYSSSKNQREILKNKTEILSLYQKKKIPKFSAYNFVGDLPWNNARILSVSLYSHYNTLFNDSFKCFRKDKMGTYLKYIKDKNSEKGGDPFELLKKLCEAL